MTTDFERRVRGLLQAMVAGDPDDGAADAVTCWMVWQKEAADLLALSPASSGAGGDLSGPARTLWEVYHAACHLLRDGEGQAQREGWLAEALAAFEAAHPQFKHGAYFQPVLPDPAPAAAVADVLTYTERDIEMMARGMASWSNLYWDGRDTLFHEMPQDEREKFVQDARDLAADAQKEGAGS